MPYPKLDDLKAGDKLVADAGFTCLKDGEIVTVKENRHGELYVSCAGSHDDSDYGCPAVDTRNEEHNLEGQIDDGDEVVGFTRWVQ